MKTPAQVTGRLEAMVKIERENLVEFLVYLEELDRRKLYAKVGYSSTYAYCTEKLRLTNSSAYRRIEACRLLRRFPVVAEYLRSGRVSLAKLAILEDVLDANNCEELLDRAEHRSEYEVRVMAAARRPGATSVAEVKITPIDGEMSEIRLTVSNDFLELIDEAKAVLSHQIPRGELERVLRLCMLTTIHARKRRRQGAPKPRAAKAPRAISRRVPVAVKREVWRRDDGRCTYTAPDGTRCNSRHQVEEHHIVPAGMHGPSTVENITLHCRAHNLLRAREDYGEAHMAQFTANRAEE